MATAIIKGMIDKFDNINKNIFVSDKDISKVEKISSEFYINKALDNIDVVKNTDIIILAVKPNIYGIVLEEINEYITKDHIIVSIAAGINIDYMEKFFKEPVKIIRTMPNTPVFVGEGMIAITKNKIVSSEELDLVVDIFSSLGIVDVIDEKLMEIIPAVSASSPAYVYMFIEALADGAVLQGMDRKKAYKYASQAVLGAAKMVLETGIHPGELKDQVCSPGGTTIEAVYALEKGGFRATIIDAMEACTEKAKNIMDKN